MRTATRSDHPGPTRDLGKDAEKQGHHIVHETLQKSKRKINKMKKTDYEKWKAGELNIYKAPWVIKYYESVTDENQHRLSVIVTQRAMIITCIMFHLLGLLLGAILW